MRLHRDGSAIDVQQAIAPRDSLAIQLPPHLYRGSYRRSVAIAGLKSGRTFKGDLLGHASSPAGFFDDRHWATRHISWFDLLWRM